MKKSGQPVIDIEAVRAAYARGWTVGKIAKAAGVSRQAIEQRLEERKARVIGFRTPLVSSFKCANCGTISKRRFSRVQREACEYSRRFCSPKCASYFNKPAGCDAETREAIRARQLGKAWGTIAYRFGITAQSLQKRIWFLLAREGRLDRETVETIWNPALSSWPRTPSWRWIERSTGKTARTREYWQ